MNWLTNDDKRSVSIGLFIVSMLILIFGSLYVVFSTTILQRLSGNQYVSEQIYLLDMIVVTDIKTDNRACYRKLYGSKDFQLVTCPTDDMSNPKIRLPK